MRVSACACVCVCVYGTFSTNSFTPRTHRTAHTCSVRNNAQSAPRTSSVIHTLGQTVLHTCSVRHNGQTSHIASHIHTHVRTRAHTHMHARREVGRLLAGTELPVDVVQHSHHQTDPCIQMGSGRGGGERERERERERQRQRDTQKALKGEPKWNRTNVSLINALYR